jgi:hypothetical protein
MDDAVLPPSHVTLHEAGAHEYEPGPANFGVSPSPEQDHSAAEAVPMGLSAASPRSRRLRLLSFGARGAKSETPVPLLLFSAPLTTLTATSDPEGLEAASPVDLDEQATALHARTTDDNERSAC